MKALVHTGLLLAKSKLLEDKMDRLSEDIEASYQKAEQERKRIMER